MVEIQVWHIVVWYVVGVISSLACDAKLNKEISLASIIIALGSGLLGPLSSSIIVFVWLILDAPHAIFWKKKP